LIDHPYITQHKSFTDVRGVTSRIFDVQDLAFLNVNEIYTLMARNSSVGTIRGMHMGAGSTSRTKLVTVVRGKIFDMCVDMRRGSPTRWQVYAGFLEESEGVTLVIPPGFLHGYQTLEPDTTVIYALDEKYGAGLGDNYSPISASISHHWPIRSHILSVNDAGGPELEIRSSPAIPFMQN
jgi:dTDP-4-dehydrorhamnose 3,5-epimerase